MPVTRVEFYGALLCEFPEQVSRFPTGGAEPIWSMGFLLDTRVRVLMKPFSATALRIAISVVRETTSVASSR